MGQKLELPKTIPLIKLKDNYSGREFYFGNDHHDTLQIENNSLSYYNLQCGDGTGFPIEKEEGYTFVPGYKDKYYCLVETIELSELIDDKKIKELVKENQSLKEENARLKMEMFLNETVDNILEKLKEETK